MNMIADTTPSADHAARIHAATVAIHEAVEGQLSDSSEVSAIVALDTIDAAADALAAALGDTNNQKAHPMDTLNDHAARISARIEEYRTLDLIGRNSADDLQHHLRALVAERDEANARAARFKAAFEAAWEDVVTLQTRLIMQITDWSEAEARASVRVPYVDDYLQSTDLDGAPGDTN